MAFGSGRRRIAQLARFVKRGSVCARGLPRAPCRFRPAGRTQEPRWRELTGLFASDDPNPARQLRRVHLVAPTSTDERIRLAAESTDGWLYLVTLTGTTGARAELSSALEAELREREWADAGDIWIDRLTVDAHSGDPGSISKAIADAIAARHPLGLGQADDLVGAYSYLASDASRWTTGSALVVDGGYAAP